MWKLIWKDGNHSSKPFVMLDANGECHYLDLDEAKKEVIENDIECSTVYTNDLYLSECTNSKIIANSFYEMLSFFSALGIKKFEKIESVSSELVSILERFHLYFTKLENALLKAKVENKDTYEISTYKNTINWLARTNVRIYPNEAIQDRHVYCTRWHSLHWSNILELGFVSGEPSRDAKLLKGLRADSSRIKFVDGCAFVLVKFIKISNSYDMPLGAQVWLTNIELMALMESDNLIKFEIEDILISNIEPFDEEVKFIYDTSLFLSCSFGLALKTICINFPMSWTKAYWASIERARWISLLNEVHKKFALQVSGMGEGSISFYCWSGDVAGICQYIKTRASVLKQDDFEIEEYLLSEMSNSVLYRLNEDYDDYQKQNSNFSSI